MKSKIIIFCSLIFMLSGCGVMNKPIVKHQHCNGEEVIVVKGVWDSGKALDKKLDRKNKKRLKKRGRGY